MKNSITFKRKCAFLVIPFLSNIYVLIVLSVLFWFFSWAFFNRINTRKSSRNLDIYRRKKRKIKKKNDGFHLIFIKPNRFVGVWSVWPHTQWQTQSLQIIRIWSRVISHRKMSSYERKGKIFVRFSSSSWRISSV